MDIAYLRGGDFKIIELNSMVCSCLYKSDISKIIPALRECVIKEFYND